MCRVPFGEAAARRPLCGYADLWIAHRRHPEVVDAVAAAVADVAALDDVPQFALGHAGAGVVAQRCHAEIRQPGPDPEPVGLLLGFDPAHGDECFVEISDTADAAFDAMAAVIRHGALPVDVVAAASIIEERGFTTIDDIVHGYGGGYLSPILSSKSRTDGAHPIPDEPFEAGMIVVIQPNVVTSDQRAGVQTGEMVRVTETGIERMHQLPRGLGQIG